MSSTTRLSLVSFVVLLCACAQSVVRFPDGGACEAGQALCGSACVKVASDKDNCGTCGTKCATGLVCVTGACTPATTCDSSSPCTTDKVCRANRCETCVEGTDDPLCGAGKICVAGACVAGDCHSTSDCSGGSVCKNNACVACVDGTDDALCGAGKLCVGGACVTGDCHTSATCTGGKICKANTCATCVDPADDALCGTGKICNAGTCIAGDCHGNAGCSGGKLCKANTCATCVDGTDDALCGAGKVCSGGACVPGTCQTSAMCSGGTLCKSNMCVACIDSTDDALCGSGKVCAGGVCVAGDCHSNANCSSGKVCKANTCVTCTDTTDDALCGSGNICVGGACVAGDCHTNASCSGGKVCKANTCATCVDTTDDALCGSGKLCAGGACVTGDCHTSATCTGGKVCKSNVCGACNDPADDALCGSGKLCLSGACTTAACRTTPDCTNAKVCKANACATCTDVTDDALCGSGKICVSGACATGTCHTNADCTGGKACVSNACIACTQHAQCGATELCLTGACSAYRMARSVRFTSSRTTVMTNTQVSPTDGRKATMSFWLKKTVVSPSTASYSGVAFGGVNNVDMTQVAFSEYAGFDNHEFKFAQQLGAMGGYFTLQTNQLFRDPTAWAHYVIAYDSTQAVTTDRIKLYVNGQQLTSFKIAQYPPLNHIPSWQVAGQGRGVGKSDDRAGLSHLDGYLSDVQFIDGQALAPTAFAQRDATTGAWQPVRYGGTYGANGYWLDFSDASATTPSALGKDRSGANNDFTSANLSVVPGVNNDALLDTPVSVANGGNGLGNYPTLSPIDAVNSTLSNGNLQWSPTVSTTAEAHGSIWVSSGKWWLEVTATSVGDPNDSQGLGLVSTAGHLRRLSNHNTPVTYQAYWDDGNPRVNLPSSLWANGTVWGLAVDFTNDSIAVYQDGTLKQTFTSQGLQGKEWTLFVNNYGSNGRAAPSNWAVNFGQRPFSMTPPAGFLPLNTLNLPAASIAKPNTVMSVLTYTGTGAVQSLVSGFQPDLVWLKKRNAVGAYGVFDSMRGPGVALASSTNNPETTVAQSLTAFGPLGFTLGTDGLGNAATDSYVAWAWSAGTPQGFGVFQYTGDGNPNHAVTHNAGGTPEFIIVKERDGTSGWRVWHKMLIAGSNLLLEQTSIPGTFTDRLGDTFGATTFTVCMPGVGCGGINAPGKKYQGYAFRGIEGFSRFGRYTGNGNADGPFVWTGFTPKLVIIKNITTADNWQVLDSARNPGNPVDSKLEFNNTTAEQAANPNRVDFTAGGFKLRGADNGSNATGATYVFAAFAEQPFATSRAR